MEKLSKSTRINSLKLASLEAISEIISDLCSPVSFIVLDLIRYCTTNIRTLELMHVLGTVSPPIENFDREVVGGMEGGKEDTKKRTIRKRIVRKNLTLCLMYRSS